MARKDWTALPHGATLDYLGFMFAALRRAWKEAVENFRRELDPELYDSIDGPLPDAVRREVEAARRSLRRLEDDLAAARGELAHELQELERCRRREELARRIDDLETARIAADFAGRHAERAEILRRKTDALAAEIDFTRRGLEELLAFVRQSAPGSGMGTDHRPPETRFQHDEAGLDVDPLEAEFEQLEDEVRRRAADERLDDLEGRRG